MQTYSKYTYKDVEMPKMQTCKNVTNAQAPTYHTYTKCKNSRNGKITTTCKRQKATHVKIRKCRNVNKYRISKFQEYERKLKCQTSSTTNHKHTKRPKI